MHGAEGEKVDNKELLSAWCYELGNAQRASPMAMH